jgi:hypothetical protein
MEKINETEKLIIHEEVVSDGKIIYREHKENEDDIKAILKYASEDIIYYHNEDKEIVFQNYKELPKYISPYGYGFKNKAVEYFFRGLFDKDIEKIYISPKIQSEFKNNEIYLNEIDLNGVIREINQEQTACNQTKKALLRNLFSKKFSELGFEFKETNNNKDLILRNLNSKLIEKLTADDVERVGAFYVKATQKYTRADFKRRMILDLQAKTKLVTLQEIIKEYEELLEKNPPEAKWQALFDKYIMLFDNRYTNKLDYKNIATGLTKYPDLVLTDIYGYIDFYELKKSGVKLLSYDSSHKTYYWSADVSKVISQASNYLQNAKNNALSYKNSIKEETGIDVNIINPKGIIVAGSSLELDNVKKQNQFKALRESLKDVEFILYDELLDRFKHFLEQLTSNEK